MSEKTFWSCSTVKELAQTFAEIVKQNYLSDLNYLKAIARDSPYEFIDLETKIKKEPNEVKSNAQKKILRIMQNPEINERFYKRIFRFFRSKNIISITKSSGFYNNLLKGVKIENTVAVNVEYIIDKRSLTIRKKIYLQDEIL